MGMIVAIVNEEGAPEDGGADKAEGSRASDCAETTFRS